MEPLEVAACLYNIAARIKNSQHPSATLAAHDIRNVLAAIGDKHPKADEVISNFQTWLGTNNTDEWADEIPHWAEHYVTTDEGEGLSKEDVMTILHGWLSSK